jgi:hypothetical protein
LKKLKLDFLKVDDISIFMDTEIYVQLLRKTLKPGDTMVYGSPEVRYGLSGVQREDALTGVFTRFEKIWYGRLANPGCVPGLYWDRNNVILTAQPNAPVDGDSPVTHFQMPTKDVVYQDSTIPIERKKLLGSNWHEIDLNEDLITQGLPETKFMEGDIVTLTDIKHPNYVAAAKDLYKNQYTIYRTYYDAAAAGNPSYRLRAGKVQFNAEEEQLQLAAQGPIRIFYASEAVQLHWKSLKDEAEFYLLLGRFTRLFNTEAFSYKWILKDAQQQVFNRKGDGILKIGDSFSVVQFKDREIGSQVSCESDLILDI